MAMTRRDFLQASLATLAAACATPKGSGPGGAAGADASATSAAQKGPSRVLILGGTSFLGPALVEVLRARGDEVTLFNRGKTNPGRFTDVEQLHGDRDGKLDALRGRTWDVVIDTSGYVPRIVRMSAELLAPSVSRYVFVSSISVYDEAIPPGSDEGAKVAVLSDPKTEDVRANYGALKAACERAAEEAMPGRVLVVRPGLIVGPGDPTDRFTYWPVRLAEGGEALAPGDGEDPIQVIDVRDLAAWMASMSARRATGTFNAVGPAARTSMRQMLAACMPPSGGASLAWVPAAFLEKEKVEPWSDMPVWIPAGGPESGMSQVSIARAVALGLRFRPLDETARDTLAWWNGLPAERRARPRAGLSRERERQVLAAWKASRRATG
ncbi:MAG TPA: NAD-dependent epimerase/dehydratase family protein [Anaeromyxobacteraceae bacterium]|nr:NAD-dependent epimerase/dehydratase family protein [Anaeromyxobacteraceae bacterium]